MLHHGGVLLTAKVLSLCGFSDFTPNNWRGRLAHKNHDTDNAFQPATGGQRAAPHAVAAAAASEIQDSSPPSLATTAPSLSQPDSSSLSLPRTSSSSVCFRVVFLVRRLVGASSSSSSSAAASCFWARPPSALWPCRCRAPGARPCSDGTRGPSCSLLSICRLFRPFLR